MSEEDELTGLHWKKIKALVEDAGGKWTDMGQGLVFLRSLKNDSTEEDLASNDDPAEAESDGVVTAKDLENEQGDVPVFDSDEYHSTIAGDSNVAYMQGGHSFTSSKEYIDPEDIE